MYPIRTKFLPLEMSDNIIILCKIMSDKLLSGSILRICDYIAMSDNIIILIYITHANI